MVEWKDLTLERLRAVAQYYNKDVKIVGVSKMKKADLTTELKKHIKFDGTTFTHKTKNIEYEFEADTPKPKKATPAPKKATPAPKEATPAPKKATPSPKKTERFSFNLEKLEKLKSNPQIMETFKKMDEYKKSGKKQTESVLNTMAKIDEMMKTNEKIIEEGVKEVFYQQFPSFMKEMISKEQVYKDKFLTKSPAEQAKIRKMVRDKMKKDGIIK